MPLGIGHRADRNLIIAASFLRSLSISGLGVLLGIHLAQVGFKPSAIGLIVGAGLAGGACSALIITILGDRWPRRPLLITLTLFSAGGMFALVWLRSEHLLLAASFLGMVNGMGRDRGALLILEQAILPGVTDDRGRTSTFAWYNVFQDGGHALGGVLVALPGFLSWGGLSDPVFSQRLIFSVCGTLTVLSAICYAFLSSACLSPPSMQKKPITPETKRVVTKISSLFLLDALGGGFLTTAMVSYFFFERFGVSVGQVGLLFTAARALNAFSHLGASWLASRIGLVNTMVFTHIPSSVLLASVVVAPNFTIAVILFLLREGLVEMDVPTRQSYIMAMVKPEERTFASGVTGLVRMGGWAAAPSFAGLFMQNIASASPLIAGSGLKIIYDILLYVNFRRLPPPEERAAPA